MFKTSDEVIVWLSQQPKFGVMPGLLRMETALLMLQNPHEKLKVIHIAGTNGKGSTLTYLRCILEEANYQVGSFTSPYIEMFHERICLNGVPISDEELVKCANVIQPVAKTVAHTVGPMAEFELITLMSFVYFSQQAVDVVLYEVGLGGRIDPTNVVMPVVSVVTNVGHDHQGVLGETLEEIAHEKFGIMKRHVSVVTMVEQSELRALMKREGEKLQTDIVFCLQHKKPDAVTFEQTGMRFIYDGVVLELSMHGEHQVKNAILAYETIKLLNKKEEIAVNDVCIYRGLKKATWKGRFEVIQYKGKLIILDGAHNEEGMNSLCEVLRQKYPDKHYHVLMSVLRDKQLSSLISPLKALEAQLYFTTFDFYRAPTRASLNEAAMIYDAVVYEPFTEGIHKIMLTLQEDDCFVVTGSLYFISEVRKYVLA